MVERRFASRIVQVLVMVAGLAWSCPDHAFAKPVNWPLQPSRPRHNVHAGAGWQNTGASRAYTWEPAIQGSRKDVPVFVGWSMVGNRRLYYAPFARLKYANTWSIGGATNLLGLDLGFGGLGVYMTRPPERDRAAGRWFAVFEINLVNLRFGGNLAPKAPSNGRVADPDAHREMLVEQKAMGEPIDHTLQRYPFGPYSYIEMAFPFQVRVWKQFEENLGVGFFVDAQVFGLEWPLDRRVTRFAQVYHVTGGLSITLGRGRGR